MEKEELKIGKKTMFFFVWFRRENTEDGKYGGKKIHPSSQIFNFPDLGGKVGRKERKWG